MEQSNSISVVKLNSHKPPVFKEEKNKEWIVMGTDRDWYNNYPQYLIKLFDTSHLHNSIINSKVHYICGNGLSIDNTGLSVEESSYLINSLNKTNSYGESILDLIKKCVLDKQLFNTFYIEIIFNKSGDDFECLHIPYEYIREDKNGEGFWYSNDWSVSQQSEEKTGLKFIPNASLDEKVNGIIPFKVYQPGCKHYTKVSYIGGIPYIEADGEVANYNLQGIKSQFNVGTIISFNNGVPTEEEKKFIDKKLKEKFSGTDAANSLLINYSKTKDNAPTIERLQSPDFAEQYKNLKEQIVDAIIQTHRFPPILAGIQVAGKLGNSQEYNDALETLYVSQIKPEQKLIEDFFNNIFSHKGFSNRIRINKPEKIKAQWSESTLKEIMTPNEMRESIGLEKLVDDNIDSTVTDKLNTVSPLVATKILDNMDKNEIRQLIGLPDIEITPEPVSTMKHHFNENIIEVFSRYGVSFDDYEILESKPYSFALESALYRDILIAIRESPSIDNKQLAQLLKNDISTINKAVKYLEDNEYIKIKKTSSIDLEGEKDKKIQRIISDKADNILKKNPPKLDEYDIMYYYDWRPDIPSSERDSSAHPSRDFCKSLMRLNKLYSENDIKEISKIVGWDVLRYKGGWWNDDGINRPYCRHLWYTKKVKKK